ncbi:MAG: hypothetical protein D5R97_07500 [Candidatus Syntrophonatronum acetioxidans]|uniref:Transposase IS200-like domain-containing protein n=1 Tax=Candidatus Syntrophonatronum acetioxidans TaxID=1795816 RepID=A0A424YCW3_9FIRM|nr:MAG: hypothetical protein D5R97_07500 [Candidatus Syntrophonatronum acetioxidans]
MFRRDADKRFYLNNLVNLKKRYLFQLSVYVLMNNHYHLLLQTGKDPLHKIMFCQNMLYNRYFNKSH